MLLDLPGSSHFGYSPAVWVGELHGSQLEACGESGVRPGMGKGEEGSAHMLCLATGMGVGEVLNSSASGPCQLRHDTRTKGTFYRWEIIGAATSKTLATGAPL